LREGLYQCAGATAIVQVVATRVFAPDKSVSEAGDANYQWMRPYVAYRRTEGDDLGHEIRTANGDGPGERSAQTMADHPYWL
jgi:hypothetical protein